MTRDGSMILALSLGVLAIGTIASEEAGVELVYAFDSGDRPEGERASLRDRAVDVVRARLENYGVREFDVRPVGADRFSVKVGARVRDRIEAIQDLVARPGKLEFRITVEPSAPTFSLYWEKFVREREAGVPLDDAQRVTPEERVADDVAAKRYPHGLAWHRLSPRAEAEYNPARLPGGDGGPEPWVLVRLDAQNVGGADLENVLAEADPIFPGAGWRVLFDVRKTAQERMAGLTAAEGEFMAILLDGRVDSAPLLNTSLSASGLIQGAFSEEDARKLAVVLQAGALPEAPSLVSETAIPADR